MWREEASEKLFYLQDLSVEIDFFVQQIEDALEADDQDEYELILARVEEVL